MIGWYVHHQGVGHAQRAAAVCDLLDQRVTGLSTAPPPARWSHGWVQLPPDDAEPVHDVTANGALHWVPEGHPGQRERMAELSRWIARDQPSLLVVDVSVEVAVLARLHGVPVVTTVLPGRRDDPAHRLVHHLARRVVAAWPAGVAGMVSGLGDVAERLEHVGAMSRFDDRTPTASAPPAPSADGSRHVVVLGGRGGGTPLGGPDLERARAQADGWRWTVLDGSPDHWTDDPWPVLCSADVVVCHAGQNTIAEVAAAGVPAVVVPLPRPFDEQRHTAAALAATGFPVEVVTDPAEASWSDVLEHARLLPAAGWWAWNDRQGARRYADVVTREAGRPAGERPA